MGQVNDFKKFKNIFSKHLKREITVKIGLERINIQKEVTVEMLDSGVTKLVMSSELTRLILSK